MYNLVCFLYLHEPTNTTVVVRVPLRSDDVSANHKLALSKRIESGVATMEFIGKHTNISLPHAYHHSTTFGNDVRSPYIIIFKVDTLPHSLQYGTTWVTQVLRQVIDILLESGRIV